uniref:Uncharacterized protein n=1 Tax=Rhizophora mucronata TaxID=61149 RepID=A0A2P2JTE6_RHIMU
MVEHNNDLLLPPYPSCPPQSFLADNHYPSHFPSTHKSVQSGVISGEAKINLNESESDKPQTTSKISGKCLGHAIGAAAKAAIMVVGVISILGLSGLTPSIGKKGSMSFKVLGSFQQAPAEKKREILQCPPGKVLQVEHEEARCLVKERVVVPFETAVAKSDVNYGCD